MNFKVQPDESHELKDSRNNHRRKICIFQPTGVCFGFHLTVLNISTPCSFPLGKVSTERLEAWIFLALKNTKLTALEGNPLCTGRAKEAHCQPNTQYVSPNAEIQVSEDKGLAPRQASGSQLRPVQDKHDKRCMPNLLPYLLPCIHYSWALSSLAVTGSHITSSPWKKPSPQLQFSTISCSDLAPDISCISRLQSPPEKWLTATWSQVPKPFGN